MVDFNSIIGHEKIIDHLQSAIRMKKISHAYILNGEKGTGKKLLANVFAKTLQCEAGGINPCNTCKSCLQMDSDNQPDVRFVTHEKVSIGVDDIRIQVNSDMGIKPYSSPYKIYVIDEAEKMTEQAQNALLKTIEEPPEYGIIILLSTNVTSLLPTILSRCVTLNVKAINVDVIKEYLIKKLRIPDYLAGLSAAFSQGNVGKAIRFASSEEFIAIKDDVLHLLKYIDDMEIYEIIEAIKKLGEHKLEINDYIDLMMLWYRDVLMYKATSDPNTLLYKDEINYISKQASIHRYDGLEKIIGAMDKAKVRLNANVNFDLVMELMLLTLKEN